MAGGRLQLASGRVIRVGRSFREAFDKHASVPLVDFGAAVTAARE